MHFKNELKASVCLSTCHPLLHFSKRWNATALKSIPFDWQIDRMVLRSSSSPECSESGDRAVSPLSLSRCYEKTLETRQTPMNDLLHTSLDQPEHLVTWNMCEMMTHRIPVQSTLSLMQRMPSTVNIAPILRHLPVDDLTLDQRISLIQILLQRELIPEATIEIDQVFSSHCAKLIPLPKITDLWRGIVRKFFTCPRLMLKWLDSMPCEWSMPADIATKLIISPLIAPISLAYKVIRLYSKSKETLSPSPYYAFFLVAKSTLKGKLLESVELDMLELPQASLLRGASTRGVLHWRCIWEVFQCLNRKIPNWSQLLSRDQVHTLSTAVLETMLVRAPPVMCLYTARWIAKEGIVGESHCAVLLLKRLPENLLHQSIPVMRRIYTWLAQQYLFQNGFPFDVLTVANALIRADLFDCVADLYDGIFQGIHSYSTEQKQRIIDTFVDIVCPECANILRNSDVYAQRVCMSCFAKIAEKGKEEKASFQPSVETLAASKRRNREVFKDNIKELRSRHDIGTSQPERVDPLARLRREVLEEPVLPAKVSLGSREIELSLPANQLEIKDVEALRNVTSRRHEIESRCAFLQSSKFDLSLDSLGNRKAELPSTTSLKSLITGFDTKSIPAAPLVDSENNDVQTEIAISERIAVQRRAPLQPLFIKSTIRSWECIWCGESNGSENRTGCHACGAETGPDSVWRTFLFCPNKGEAETQRKPTNIEELEYRLTDIAKKSCEHVVSAAYWVMLYQKKFLLTANEEKIRSLNSLAAALCAYKERVMAAYVYFRLIPPAYREKHCIVPLMRLFGTHGTAKGLSRESPAAIPIARIVGKTTCTTCFDLCHTWQECPLIARRALAQPKVTREAKSEHTRMSKPVLSHAERLEIEEKALLANIAEIRDFHSGKRAFTFFLELADPMHFCECNVAEANAFVQSLLEFGHRKRSAYVFNHIARHQRANLSYELLGKWYGVSKGEMASQLERRRIGDRSSPHPYFAQVIGVCCVCMEEQHAAHMCPIFEKWMQTEVRAAKIGQIQYRFRGLTAGQSQARSFCASGPERLDAFYKYLLSVAGEFSKKLSGSAVQLGVNSCVRALFTSDREDAAKKLLLRVPHSLMEVETVKCYTDRTGKKLEIADFTSDRLTPVDEVLETDVCWLCFHPGHSLTNCTRHSSKKTDDRMTDTVRECIESGQPKIIAAGADFILGHYIRGKYQLLFASRAFSQLIEGLIGRCVHFDFAVRASKLFSVLSLCTKKTTQNLFGGLKLSDANLSKLMPGTNRTEIIEMLQRHGVCPFCMVAEDHSQKCPTLQNEHDFGRNVLAIFRSEILLNGSTEGDANSLNIMSRLRKVLISHAEHLPYHIPQIRIAMNALACHYFLDKELREGMEVLLAIPMQFRKPLLYHRCLQAYGLSSPRALHDIRARLSQRVDSDDVVFSEPLHEDLFVLKDQRLLCKNCWRMGHETSKCMETVAVTQSVQMFDFEVLREEIDRIQTDMETFYGVQLGVRHPLFSEAGLVSSN